MNKKLRYDKVKKILYVDIENENDLEGEREVVDGETKKKEKIKTGISKNTVHQEINEEGIKDIMKELETQIKNNSIEYKKAREALKFYKNREEYTQKELNELKKVLNR